MKFHSKNLIAWKSASETESMLCMMKNFEKESERERETMMKNKTISKAVITFHSVIFGKIVSDAGKFHGWLKFDVEKWNVDQKTKTKRYQQPAN